MTTCVCVQKVIRTPPITVLPSDKQFTVTVASPSTFCSSCASICGCSVAICAGWIAGAQIHVTSRERRPPPMYCSHARRNASSDQM